MLYVHVRARAHRDWEDMQPLYSYANTFSRKLKETVLREYVAFVNENESFIKGYPFIALDIGKDDNVKKIIQNSSFHTSPHST